MVVGEATAAGDLEEVGVVIMVEEEVEEGVGVVGTGPRSLVGVITRCTTVRCAKSAAGEHRHTM